MFRVSLMAAALLAIAGSTAAADTLVSNLSEPTRGVTILGVADPDRIWAAQSFFTAERARLDQISVLAGAAPDGADAVAELRSGVDPSGPAITSFDMSALDTEALGIVSLVPQMQVVLEPGVQYWIVLGTATTGAFGWAYAEGNVTVGPGTLAEYSYSDDSGVSWGPAGTDNPHQVNVEVTLFCPADFDGNGNVAVPDIFAFLSAWFAQDPRADFDDDGTIAVPDIFAFLSAWFAGCP